MNEASQPPPGGGSLTQRLSTRVDTAARRTAEILPNSVKRRLAAPYNLVKTTQANRAFADRAPTRREPAPDAPRHVVLVVVDALRADAVDPRTSPFLADRLLGDAVTPSPWTFPAVTSLFTGQYPHEHGSMRQSDTAERQGSDLVIPRRLPDETATLSDVFTGAGYRTYGGFGFHMPFFALEGRFERHALYDKANAETVLNEAAEWLESLPESRTFSYLHLADLHEPVVPPASYVDAHDVDMSIPDLARWDYVDMVDPDPDPDAERYRRHRRRLYDAALAYVDNQLRRFHEQLRDTLDTPVALIVTADHGEAFWEHTAFDAAHFVDSRPAYCVDHGGTPYEALARVPIIADGFDLGPVTDASLIDIAPTLLAALGHPDAIETTGESLLDGPPADRVRLVEATRYGHEKKAGYLNEWKLIVSKGDRTAVGFRLPTEEPITLPEPAARQLSNALPAWPDGQQPDRQLSGIPRQRLKDLGYV